MEGSALPHPSPHTSQLPHRMLSPLSGGYSCTHPTLFSNAQVRTEVATQLLTASHDIIEGFEFAREVIQVRVMDGSWPIRLITSDVMSLGIQTVVQWGILCYSKGPVPTSSSWWPASIVTVLTESTHLSKFVWWCHHGQYQGIGQSAKGGVSLYQM